MQQTENLKLNLIETGDPISPAPMNENAEKVEGALAAETEARAAGDEALDSRVTVLEANKIVFGSFEAKSGAAVNLGFTPKAVLVERSTSYSHFAMVVGNIAAIDGGYLGNTLKIVENGFRIEWGGNGVAFCSGTMIYIAFA